MAHRLAVAVLTLACLASCRPEYPLCEGPGDCPDPETCHDGRCVQCTGDEQCPGDRVCASGTCETIEGWCEDASGCEEGRVCLFNICSPCFEDGHCPEGMRCVSGLCAGCAADADCGEGLVCLDGGCAPPAVEPDPGSETPECNQGPVYFAFDSAVLDGEAKETLRGFLECADPSRVYTLVGRADELGDEEYNLDLGWRRAENVKKYLVDQGFPAGQLVISSAGKKLSGAGDPALDRRVDIL